MGLSRGPERNRSAWLGGALVVLLASCGRGAAPPPEERPAVLSAIEGPGPEPAEPVAQPPDSQGAVITVVTRLGNNAPAAVLDYVAVMSVEVLDKNGRSATVDVPLGGMGMLSLPEAHGEGWLRVRLRGPDQSTRLENQIIVSRLGGTVGVLGLEVSPRAERLGCARCSSPQSLGEVRGLDGTSVFWSAQSEPADEDGQALLIATRASFGDAERQALLGVLGEVGLAELEHGGEASDTSATWSMLTPTPPITALTAALGLAGRPEVVGIEVYEHAASGAFWVDLVH